MQTARKQCYRVVVLAGGDSSERQVSLDSGASVVQVLTAAGHQATLIDPLRVNLDTVDWDVCDVCLVALHGGAGEDGRVQEFLADRGVCYTGSDAVASAAAMSKSMAKRLFRRVKVPTPEHIVIRESAFRQDRRCEQIGRELARLGFPLVVKPDSQGSSLGVLIAQNAGELPTVLNESGRCGWPLIAEKYIAGRELTVAVLGRRALPPLEIVGCSGIFDYEHKYAGDSNPHHTPQDLLPITLERLQAFAVAAAAALGTSGLVRVDMILDDRRQPWVLELNTVPGMTPKSLAPKAAEQIGWSMSDLCDWMLQEAIVGHRKREEVNSWPGKNRKRRPSSVA